MRSCRSICEKDEVLGGTGLVEAGTYIAILGGTLLAGVISVQASAVARDPDRAGRLCRAAARCRRRRALEDGHVDRFQHLPLVLTG